LLLKVTREFVTSFLIDIRHLEYSQSAAAPANANQFRNRSEYQLFVPESLVTRLVTGLNGLANGPSSSSTRIPAGLGIVLATPIASSRPNTCSDSEPPMNARLSSWSFVHTRDFMSSSKAESGVC
jgi:hypothetical protein